jgi:hypothetical protein
MSGGAKLARHSTVPQIACAGQAAHVDAPLSLRNGQKSSELFSGGLVNQVAVNRSGAIIFALQNHWGFARTTSNGHCSEEVRRFEGRLEVGLQERGEVELQILRQEEVNRPLDR